MRLNGISERDACGLVSQRDKPYKVAVGAHSAESEIGFRTHPACHSAAGALTIILPRLSDVIHVYLTMFKKIYLPETSLQTTSTELVLPITQGRGLVAQLQHQYIIYSRVIFPPENSFRS